MPFKKVFAFSVAAVLLGAVGVYGMKMITYQPSGPVEVDAVGYPFKLVVRLNTTTYELGEPIRIEMKLVNIGNSSLDFWFLTYNPSSWFRFRVYNETGDLVFDTCTLLALPAGKKVHLDPGALIGYIHEYEQTAEDFRTGTLRQVEPGTYTIIAALDNFERFDSPEPLPRPTLEIPPVQITIK